jgi:hypothetical protein
MRRYKLLVVLGVAALVGPAMALPVTGTPGAGATARDRWQVRVLAQNQVVTVNGNPFSVSKPDDLTQLGRHLFVSYQNGVGAQGEPTPSGVDFSTAAEYSLGGSLIASWDLTGKVDGIAADTKTGKVIATVNEDDNSSIYTIDPGAVQAPQVVHYKYSPADPLPHGGGTDAIAIYLGQVLVSASAPGTVQGSAANPPAVYQVSFQKTPGTQKGTATLTAVFGDNSSAIVANTGTPPQTALSPAPPSWCATGATTCTTPAEGSSVVLALTDPDSSEVVPHASMRFGGHYVLDSQGDQQLIFMAKDGSLSDLFLNQSIDDTGYISFAGQTLYATDASANAVIAVNGPVSAGDAITVATPSGANNAVNANDYFATLNLNDGDVESIPALATWQPKSLIVGNSGDDD